MIGPKEKKERSLGVRLGLKGERCNSPKCAVVRKPYRPGAHGHDRPKNKSEFGRQIEEKQKFKLSYGLKERGLRTLFERAAQSKGSTAQRLLELMERRLDNVVFRLGIVESRSQARQVVLHGHIVVNEKRVRSPGFLVNVGDVVAVRESSRQGKIFKEALERLKKYEPPAWLLLEAEKFTGKVLSLPSDLESPFEINLLIESFSK